MSDELYLQGHRRWSTPYLEHVGPRVNSIWIWSPNQPMVPRARSGYDASSYLFLERVQIHQCTTRVPTSCKASSNTEGASDPITAQFKWHMTRHICTSYHDVTRLLASTYQTHPTLHFSVIVPTSLYTERSTARSASMRERQDSSAAKTAPRESLKPPSLSCKFIMPD